MNCTALRHPRVIYASSILDKPHKEYFPIEIRRLLYVKEKNSQVEIAACVIRKNNKEGAKFKELTFTFTDRTSKLWANALEKLIYGGPQPDIATSKSILILIDKNDSKEAKNYVEKLMKPVFEAAKRSVEVKGNVRFDN